MPACAFRSCTSGYKTNFEKRRFFCVPKDEKLRQEWVKIIGKEIDSKKCVCDKHFNPDDIIWKEEMLAADGSLLAVVHRKRPKLKPGAIPFEYNPIDANVKNQYPGNKISSNRQSNNSSFRKLIKFKNDDGECKESLSQESKTFSINKETKSSILFKENHSDDLNRRINTVSDSFTRFNNNNDKNKHIITVCNNAPKYVFSDINKQIGGSLDCSFELDHDYARKITSHIVNKPFGKPDIENEVDLCDTFSDVLTFHDIKNSQRIYFPMSWSQHSILTDGDGSCVIIFHKTKCRILNGIPTIIIEKELIIKENLSFIIKIVGLPINPSELKIENKIFKTIEQIQDIIQVIDLYSVCTGNIKDCKFNSAVEYLDPYGIIRHKQCPKIITFGTKCKFCNTCTRTSVKRKKESMFKQENRKRLCISDVTDEKRQKIIEYKNEKFKKDLEEIKRKLSMISSKNLEDIMQENVTLRNLQHILDELLSVVKETTADDGRYSRNWLLLCLILHICSPTIYQFLQSSVLPLPSVHMVRRYLSIIDLSYGFDLDYFNLLKKCFAEKEDIQKHGILIIDEQFIQPNADAQSNVQTHVEFSNSNMNEMADSSLILLFQPLYDSYIQPMAIFISKEPITGLTLTQILLKAIVIFEEAGAFIHGIVSNDATNSKFWKEVGVDGSLKKTKSYFEHPIDSIRKIFVFSNTLQLIMALRDRLYDNKELQVDTNSGIIKWNHFLYLFNKDSKLPSDSRLCKKITQDHVILNTKSNMNVRLAFQVFSKTTANGLRFYKKYNSNLEDCDETANFCEWVNDVFDALNNNSTTHGLTLTSPHMVVLQNALNKLNNWEENVVDQSISPERFLKQSTVENFRVTLTSTINIIKYLTELYNVPYILTEKLNSSTLEIRLSAKFYKSFSRETILVKNLP